MDCKSIKLVIWDLDETLWNGILSDGIVDLPVSHIDLIKNMVDGGVMCSICSKNDEQIVFDKLQEYGIKDYFVFPSINWSPKGERVRQIVNEMQLRFPNVLFVDDNALNRAEVLEYCHDINVADVDVIPELIEFFKNNRDSDKEHKRLKQYYVLEKKKNFKAAYASNEAFLYASNIQVKINHDCINHIDRIEDLILRSNQLNFTKIRSKRNELLDVFSDENFSCGYVSVTDRFGDYGIVGFYALKDSKLVHFVFSCRTLGMGVEQYVYRFLACPKIDIKGDVSSDLFGVDPDWINQKSLEFCQGKKDKTSTQSKILIKGPCDMSQMFAYIADGDNIITEFVYVNGDGVHIEQVNHTLMILQSVTVDSKIKDIVINKYPFTDDRMFKTSIFDKDLDFVVFSLFTDPNLGVYRDKETGVLLPFGEYVNDITNESIWPDLISQKLYVSGCSFTLENLRMIKQNLEYVGRLSPEQIYNNIKWIFHRMGENVQLILVLGSEIPFIGNILPAYEDRDVFNKELNTLIRNFALNNNRIHIIDVNNYISGQESFVDNINHFKREVYFKMSGDLVKIVNESGGAGLKDLSEFEANLEKIRRKVRRVFKKKENQKS